MEYVADIGTAWLGRKDVARRLIERAKEAGATTIKPQWFKAHHYQGHPLEREALRCALTPETAFNLFELIKGAELDVQFSVWEVKDAEALYSMGVRRLKVACSERPDLSLIKGILEPGQFEDLTISFPGNFVLEAAEKDGILNRHGKTVVLPYYCVPKYPAKLEDIVMPEFRFSDSNNWYGFSDHTLGWEAAMVATARGAKVIEKHIRLTAEEYREEFRVEYAHFPDELCAVDPATFGVMTHKCDQVERMVRWW